VEADVAQAQQVLDANVPECCPIIRINASYDSMPWADYQAIVAGGNKPGSMEFLPGPWEQNTDNQNAAQDILAPNAKMRELLKKCRSDNCIPVYYVPKLELQKGNVWRKLGGATVSPRDYPETTGAQDSGVGIVLHQGLALNAHSLIHELGHMLIDLPRSENGGIEHVPNQGNGDRVMRQNPPHGGKFTQQECSRIFDNIDRYRGS
jgi:hypothetical protein